MGERVPWGGVYSTRASGEREAIRRMWGRNRTNEASTMVANMTVEEQVIDENLQRTALAERSWDPRHRGRWRGGVASQISAP